MVNEKNWYSFGHIEKFAYAEQAMHAYAMLLLRLH
jgi:hypothetical protein